MEIYYKLTEKNKKRWATHVAIVTQKKMKLNLSAISYQTWDQALFQKEESRMQVSTFRHHIELQYKVSV